MKVEISEKRLVYSVPVNEKTSQWGVYSIPRLWREPDGKLFVLANGGIDSPLLQKNGCPDLLFRSDDDGANWREERGDVRPELKLLCGIDPPYCKLADGRSVCIRERGGLNPVHSARPLNRFLLYEGGDEVVSYRQGDLPPDVFGCERRIYDASGKLLVSDDVSLLMPERVLLLYGKVFVQNKPVPQRSCVRSTLLASPYVNSLTDLGDGTLGGTCFGQNPTVTDRFCGETYFIVSSDCGKTWTKRAVITQNAERYPFGLTGDGGESSLARSPEGTLYCLTRTDMSIDHSVLGGTSDAMLFVSKDNGYRWSDAFPVADSSVTPHVVALGDDLIVIVYGRPGVHLRVSDDGGKTFGEPITLIGKTLTEERSLGKGYMEAKYADMDSYSNTFLEKLSDGSFLILYTDLKYDPGDGLRHKAGFVCRITVKR